MRIDYLTSQNFGFRDRWRLVVLLHTYGMIADDLLPAEGALMLAAGEDDPAILELAILYSDSSNVEIREAFHAACESLHTHPVADGSALPVVYRAVCQAALDRGDEGVFALPDPSDADDAEWQLYYQLSEIEDSLSDVGNENTSRTSDYRTDVAALVQAYLARTIGTPLADQLRWAMKL